MTDGADAGPIEVDLSKPDDVRLIGGSIPKVAAVVPPLLELRGPCPRAGLSEKSPGIANLLTCPIHVMDESAE